MLIIVESPHKAKTISSYLGKDFHVMSSVGHIRELPSKNGSVDTENQFKMRYQVKPKSVSVIKNICDKIKTLKNKTVYLASDPDREGEGIAYHLNEVIKAKKIKDVKICRISFNEVTKKSVLDAISKPRQIDTDLVDAQESRLALDYLVGFGISPILWRKLPGSKSAGRVQSVALRMIAERESEIVAFKPKEYWSGIVALGNKDINLISEINSFDGVKFSNNFPSSEAAIDDILSYAKNAKQLLVSNIGKKKISNSPYPPFSTSSLQQDAYRHLGMSAKSTMSTAQRLYEGIKIQKGTTGLITYMRTDAISISSKAMSEVRGYISKNLGEKYLSPKPILYKTKAKNAQEAHEAIRPVDINITPDSIKNYLDDFQYKLYNLIWKRTVASQMSKNEKENKFVFFTDEKKKLESSLSFTNQVFDGYRKIYSSAFDEKKNEPMENLISSLKIGDFLDVKSTEKKQHFTNPPARFNEASLIKELESMGIGRPSTYSSIISIIQDRGYVAKNDNKSFKIEPKGMIVSYFLINYFSQYVQYDFTADLEDRLDKVSNGSLGKIAFLNSFWEDFKNNLSQASLLQPKDVIKVINKDIKNYVKFLAPDDFKDLICSKCSNEININIGKYGVYFFCSNYPDCTFRFGLNSSSVSHGAEGADESSCINLIDGKVALIKNGPYGPYLEIKNSIEDEGKIKNISIPKGFDVNDEEGLKKLATLPIMLGKHSVSEKDISLNIGRFGPYIKYGSAFISVKTDIFELTLDEAESLIAENLKKKKIFTDTKNKEIIVSKGRFGINAKYKNKYYSLKNVKTVEEVDAVMIEKLLKTELKK